MSFARAETPDADHAVLELAGERLILRADRSVYWPRTATLFVADTHFGKAGVFRRRGMGLPQGTTDADLACLGAAITATAAARVVVLGDFVHAPPAADEPWLARFAAWRARHAGVDFRVLRGNHDRMDAVPADFDVDWQAGDRLETPFVCRHEPVPDSRGPVLAGHLHPVVRLRDGGERLRLPAFWVHAHGLVLPAFSSFAGGAAVTPVAGDRLFVIGGERVIEVATGAGR